MKIEEIVGMKELITCLSITWHEIQHLIKIKKIFIKIIHANGKLVIISKLAFSEPGINS